MIDIEHLSKRFDGSATPAVDDLSLSIGDGEICVLIGPSGCGKTTTMRMINRMIEPDADASASPAATSHRRCRSSCGARSAT
jgi:osmoprotectant transport system ATP-binding protein